MAEKKIFTAQKAENAFDLYIGGNLIRVEPGMYVVRDQNGHTELLDEETYEADYGDAGTGVAGEVLKQSRKKSRNKPENKKNNTVAAPDDQNVVHVATVPQEVVDEVVEDPKQEFRMDAELPDETMFDKEVSDQKVVYGSESVPLDAEGMPPAPTEPAEPRDPLPEGEGFVSEGDVK